MFPSLDFHGPSGFEKNFTSEARAPVVKLKLSFTVAKTPEATRKAGIVNEFSQTGEFRTSGLKRSQLFNVVFSLKS